MNNRVMRANILLLLTALIWGAAFVAQRLGMDHMGPLTFNGIRFALGLMWLTLIVAETISANAGIGYLAMNAREFLQTDVVVVAIILYAILGKLADFSAQLLERVWLRWNPAYHLQEANA